MDYLDTRQLRAFQELARHQSFTSAARALHLTQSAVSHSIKALESTLDVALFERQGKTVRLTTAGEGLLPHAVDILSRMQRAIDQIDTLRHPGHGRLAVGATTSMSHAVLPAVLREFRESFPNYEVTISTDDTRQLLALIGNGEIDVAIGMALTGTSSYKFDALFEDQIAMMMAPIHPLAAKPTISPADLLDQDFIIYSRDSETFRLLARGFEETKARLRGHFQVGSMATIKEMTRLGLGIGLLAPWVAQKELAAGTLVARPLPWKRANRQWGFYSNHHRTPSKAEHVFTGICREVVKGLRLAMEPPTSTGKRPEPPTSAPTESVVAAAS